MNSIEGFVKQYYKRFIREDEDIDAVAFSIVNDFTREQCLELLQELSNEELRGLVAVLVMEQVKDLLTNGDDSGKLLH
ncbi:hypothetical protein [Sutcliffiella rhizosphaerae]|uniref:Uncharacterized protein n=1 Tax=Sutcliffiella rhizosphaerae TaxID=2880967 RepID=A0ABM8YQX9_9BACI|nr:hypothetical protein [Sutcliffiella rhizosphaerae]CAG9622424.1 hypothetical protein BACCIP111883_03215 [Sutcliffiella rhizosphaerae]